MSAPPASSSPPPPPRAFGPQYVEDVTLRDGTRVRLRLIRPSDKEQLVAGFARLSSHSRYLRFFTDKASLSESELRYLTEVDGEHHFAIGVGLIDDDDQESDGIAIGRFVCLSEEPHVAEPALAVVDDAQGQGLGRLLLLRLIAAAAERGVEAFRCDFLATNQSMQDLLRDISPQVAFEADGPVVTAQFPLPNVRADQSPEEGSPGDPMFRWFRLVAEQVVVLRHQFEAHSDGLRERWRRLAQQIRTRGWSGRAGEETKAEEPAEADEPRPEGSSDAGE